METYRITDIDFEELETTEATADEIAIEYAFEQYCYVSEIPHLVCKEDIDGIERPIAIVFCGEVWKPA